MTTRLSEIRERFAKAKRIIKDNKGNPHYVVYVKAARFHNIPFLLELISQAEVIIEVYRIKYWGQHPKAEKWLEKVK